MPQKDLKEFIAQLMEYSNPKDLEKFLKAILTPKELNEIPTRLRIIKLLKKGTSQREISEKLGVGIATITRGSMELKKGNFGDVE